MNMLLESSITYITDQGIFEEKVDNFSPIVNFKLFSLSK
jgi:hypothetical protein